MQKDLNELSEWISESLLTLNVSKCKVVSYGISFDSQYIIGNESLEKVDTIKDLEFIFDKVLSSSNIFLRK